MKALPDVRGAADDVIVLGHQLDTASIVTGLRSAIGFRALGGPGTSPPREAGGVKRRKTEKTNVANNATTKFLLRDGRSMARWLGAAAQRERLWSTEGTATTIIPGKP